MTDRAPLSITGFGFSSAFGPRWASAIEGIARKKRVQRRHKEFYDKAFNPILMAVADGFDRFEDRTTTLAQEALTNSLDLMPGDPPKSVTISLVMPEAQDILGLTEARLTEAVRLIQRAVTDQLETQSVTVEEWLVGSLGHAGVGHALHTATSLDSPSHLILATDSFADKKRVLSANDADLIFSDKTPWGFVPGEAAGALWLLRESSAIPPAILGTGSAEEAITEHDVGESAYEALSEAVRDACTGPEDFKATRWYADMNNSRYRASETAYAVHRASGFWLDEDFELEQPAVTFGDCGAAAGMSGLALALASGEPSVISGSSSGGLRSVVVI